jgi:hypothetical protein
VILFASDLYGTYTADFFDRAITAGTFKERLDGLFSEKPAEISVAETARGLTIIASSDRLVAPRLFLSREGTAPCEAEFRKSSPGAWAAEIAPPYHGEWSASILDRGSSVASFPIAVNSGLGGQRSDSERALSEYRPRLFRNVRSHWLWLLLFFSASLASTILLRVKR